MPCSTLVAITALAQPGALVEIEATAFIGAGV
jgi:enamine deaminase RidA (YjgF/YER057c/UK114 family)